MLACVGCRSSLVGMYMICWDQVCMVGGYVKEGMLQGMTGFGEMWDNKQVRTCLGHIEGDYHGRFLVSSALVACVHYK